MSARIDHDKLLATLANLPLNRREALKALPGIMINRSTINQGELHATVSVITLDSIRICASDDSRFPEGTRLPDDGIVAAAARQALPIHLAETSGQPAYRSLCGYSLPVEFALPLHEGEDVVAVLNIECQEPFNAEERCTLEFFTKAVSHQLTLNSRSLEATVTAALSAQLANAGRLKEAARIALNTIAPALGANAGVILADNRGVLQPLASYNAENHPEAYAVIERGMPYPEGVGWRACLTGKPQLVRDYGSSPHGVASLREQLGPVILALPVGQHGTRHTVLGLQYESDLQVSAADLTVLGNICRQLAIIFSAVQGRALQDRLLELQVHNHEIDSEGLYSQVLEAAIAHVPGAEAGSLLMRRDAEERFTYRAVSGFNLKVLQETSFTEEQLRAWYARPDGEWQAGKPRILTSETVDLAAFSRSACEHDQPAEEGGLTRLKSTLCLPVTYHGEILAVLNLDNFTRQDAFGDDSLRVLQNFLPPVANLLATSLHHDEILRTSITDPVTDLMNRRGYKHELEQLLVRASRQGEQFTLLVMDLNGFKSVNDALGHDIGDTALGRVAAALRVASRAGDVIARWGGDEFTALLPNTSAEEGALVVERLERTVSLIVLGGHQLSIDIGAATYPGDAVNSAKLQQIADRRMYARKAETGRVRS